jgi:hypothetical protein
MARKVSVKKQQPTVDQSALKRRVLLIFSAGVILLAAVIIGLLSRPGATPGATLKRFYTTLYTFEGNFQDIKDCLIESVHPEAEILYSPGGSSALSMYRLDAVSKVGENVSVKLKLLEQSSSSSAILQQAKALHPEATNARTYRFSLTLTGDLGQLEQVGIASLIKIKERWYMVSPNPEIAVLDADQAQAG